MIPDAPEDQLYRCSYLVDGHQAPRGFFWARVASARPDEISKAENETLKEQLLHELAASTGLSIAEIKARLRPGELDTYLSRSFELARDVVSKVAAGRPVSVLKKDLYAWQRDQDGRYQEYGAMRDALQTALGQIVLGSLDLFGKCPECGAYFVRVRRQLYCTPICTMKALESARKVEKAKYMVRHRRAKKAAAAKAAKGD